jgi:hypothetical protein
MNWIASIKEHKWIVTLLVIAPILGAVITTVNFVQKWDEWGMPRPLFSRELISHQESTHADLEQLRADMTDLEIRFLEFAIRVAGRQLRVINKEIREIRESGAKVPEALEEYQEILTQDVNNLRIRLRELKPSSGG